MRYKVFALARQHINDRNLYHSVASRLQAHRCTSHIDEYLSRKSRVVDAHVEFETLVLGYTANTLAHHIHAVAHVADIVYRRNGNNVSLIVREIRVGLNLFRNIFERSTVLKFHIHHTAMDAFAERNGH